MPKNMNDAGPIMEGSSMEQVRELLFGSQFKELEVRLQRQEEVFRQEIADAKDSLKKRLDTLENFMKSETSSMLNRINAEKTERDNAFKDAKRELDEAFRGEQRERAQAVKSEEHERAEALKKEQRERGDALAQLGKELAATAEIFERKLAALSSTLDTTERELRQLLLTESGGLSDKIEERYQQALDTLKNTAEQIRHDMVHRTALSGLFTETALKISGQWAAEIDASGKVSTGQEKSGKQPGVEKSDA